MPKPLSKRQRKQKNTNSLRQKGRQVNAVQTLAASLHVQPNSIAVTAIDNRVPEAEGSNVEVLLPRKRKQPDDTGKQLGQTAGYTGDERPLNKAQKRKLRRIEEENVARQRRSQALATLQCHSLTPVAAKLMRSSANIGQTDSRRQSVRRDLQLQRAGLPLPRDSRLLKQSHRSPGDLCRADAADSATESSEDELGQQAAKRNAVHLGKLPNANRMNGRKVKQADLRGVVSVVQQVSESASDCAMDSPPAVAHSNGDVGGHAVPVQQLDRAQLVAAAEAGKRELRQQGVTTDEVSDDEKGPNRKVPAGPQGPPAANHLQPLRVVHFQRQSQIQDARQELPIYGMEQEIMEAVTEHDVVVLAGATGCGKTTQVPQFLLEAGYGCPEFAERAGLVAVTQPRRVAAVSTCKRVAQELGTRVGDLVGYQIRHNQHVGPETRLKFMTDGILMRELQEDFLLRKYSCLLLDEAHERSLNTDLLIGLLSRVVPLRRSMYKDAVRKGDGGTPSVYPLKLLIMSATLRSDDFVSNPRLFPQPPPLLIVPTRQFPVTVHFSRRTELKDYVDAAYRKVCSIHRRLPPGGILVFVTGQREVLHLVRKLRRTFARKHTTDSVAEKGNVQAKGDKGHAIKGQVEQNGDDVEQLDECDDASEEGFIERHKEEGLQDSNRDDVDDFALGDNAVSEEDLLESGSDEDEVVVLGGEDMTKLEIKAAEEKFEQELAAASAAAPVTGAGTDAGEAASAPVHVLPLYAMLAPEGQAQVFQPPPPGARLIIVATNVAETSLTIPGIRYVVDVGRSKQKLLGAQGGALSSYEVRWISKASAEQRAGRAGRTGPGHCYRLYSSAHYNDTFPQHTPPEILNTPLESVVLALKSMGVDKVINFPFPTGPPADALSAALMCLQALAALEPSSSSAAIRDLGRQMAQLPISPRHARMLLQVVRDDSESGSKALVWGIALAAALSVETPQLQSQGHEDATAGTDPVLEGGRKAVAQAHLRFQSPDGDAITVLTILAAYEASSERAEFCRRNFLHPRLMSEMAALHKQLASIVTRSRGFLPNDGRTDSSIPGGLHAKALRSIYPLPSCRHIQHGAKHCNKHGTRGLQRNEGVNEHVKVSPKVSLALRRAMAAGWVDRVARRVRAAEYLVQRTSKRRAVRYEGAFVAGALFLHPSSPLAQTAPEYVLFTEVLQTDKRPYMRGVSVIDPAWIEELAPHMCTYLDPLMHPAPHYNAQTDSVCCFLGVRFNNRPPSQDAAAARDEDETPQVPHSGPWDLPPVLRPYPSVLPKSSLLPSAAAIFAAALLEGLVFPAWRDTIPQHSLVAAPSSICSQSGLAQARVVELVHALQVKGITSAAGLRGHWQADSAYLRREVVLWVKKDRRKHVLANWHTLVAACSETNI